MARAPTALLLEDEPLLRETLRISLTKLWPELVIAAEAGDGDEALASLLAAPPDIAFLDIRVPGTSGIEIARRFSGKVHVVFVTAHGDFAIEAFERGAVDYVLKPISLARLATTVERLKGKLGTAPRDLRPELPASLEQSEPAAAPAGAPSGAREPPREPTRWLQATVGHQTKLITVREVLYFQSDSKYTRVVRTNDEALIRKSLVELLETLDPQQFWQIHRSTVVNAGAIAGVTRDFRGRMLVKLKKRDDTLLVSDSYTHLFRQM